jgi:hypothetical protein
MDDPPQTRLEWMRSEFQDARRRRKVKAREIPASSPATVGEPAAPVVANDAPVINLPDRSTPQ